MFLRSDTAIEVNIRIMRAFTSMRHFLQNNAEVFQRLSTMEYHQLEMQHHLLESDKCIEEGFRRLDEGNAKPKQDVLFHQIVFGVPHNHRAMRRSLSAVRRFR